MLLYGHPWSLNTRKTLLTFAEKGHQPELKLVVLPKGEQKRAEHLALHPFGKVPVLDDDNFVLYETGAINRYLDRVLEGPPLAPTSAKEQARLDQWINIASAYFIPHAAPMIIELLFRRYLGGEQDQRAIREGRENIQPALGVMEQALTGSPYLIGERFSLADIYWMPYFEYLQQLGEDEAIQRRPKLAAWWQRVSERPSWQKVARTGLQPYHEGPTPG